MALSGDCADSETGKRESLLALAFAPGARIADITQRCLRHPGSQRYTLLEQPQRNARCAYLCATLLNGDGGGSMSSGAINLENRHTGERLSIRRVKRGDEIWLELKGSLPPHREGPPMHVHFAEDEEGRVKSGTLSAVLDGRRVTAGPGESILIPRGLAHRWWNEGDDLLEFEGYVRPAADLDRYLQAVFEVMNASPAGRPSLFCLAHVALRHRRTQAVLIMPRPVQAVLFRLLVAVGTVLGRYRDDDWPGCPSSCPGAPIGTEESA